jgi:hypothetical protein
MVGDGNDASNATANTSHHQILEQNREYQAQYFSQFRVEADLSSALTFSRPTCLMRGDY